jgi:PKD repeat protein
MRQMRQKMIILISMLLISNVFSIAQTVEIGKTQNDDRAWTIVETFPIPESSSGLAYDGTYLYSGIYGSNGDQIYQIDPADGSYSLLCNGPQGDAFGLTFDGTYLWTTDHPSSSNPAVAIQFAMNGSEISQFDLPDTYMSGIAYDAGDFWVSTYYNPDGWIYNIDSTGTILNDFAAPDNQPWDLCIENDNLWMVDYWGNAIYKIDPSDGSLIESYGSEGTDPSGIVWDGNYLWYCDNGQGGVDYLYKVDLGGSGTPQINVPFQNYYYGIVTVGNQEEWDLTIDSTGVGDLIVENLTFSGIGSEYLSHATSFPITIPAGTSNQITITYEPLTPGELNVTATIHSNDPIDPEVEVTLTGNAVTPGPDIYLPQDSHDFGSLRLNSYTRWKMEIKNVGDSLLTINDMFSSENHFIIDPDLSIPFDLSPLESKIVDIWFQPTEEITYSANITILSNDATDSPYNVSVQGLGEDISFPVGETIWDYRIMGSYDMSPKAIISLPDINHDQINEVIVCSEDNYIRCFNGNADHADILWEKYIYSGSLFHQQEIQITRDIDSDGYSDFVIGTPWGDRSIYTISGKTGETIWKHDTHEYGGGGWVYMIDCSKDYNNDGMQDVLSATGDDPDDTGPKRVYCLDAYTGTSIWECYIGGPVFSVIGVGDFTGDGKPDVVAGASNNLETQGLVYGIDGSTGDIEWTFTAGGSSVWALAQLDDINGDGFRDVIVGDYYGYGDVYGLDATTGQQIFNSNINAQLILRFEQIGDVNDDGYVDILPSHTNDNAVIIDGKTGDNIWSTSIADKSWCVANAHDITGDDINDVFIGTLFEDNYCYFINGANGSIVESVQMREPVDAIGSTEDIIGDGSMEFVAGLRDGTVLCISGGAVVQQPQPPVADFIFEPANPMANETIYFNSTSYDTDGILVNWTWEMGDSTILYGEQVTYSYSMNGTYLVNLTVTDNNSTTDSITKIVSVGLVETIDVNQSLFDRGFRLMPGWDAAQEFVPAYPLLSRVELYLAKAGVYTGDVTFQILKENVMGDVVFERTISANDVPGPYQWISVDVGILVNTSETYVVVLKDATGANAYDNILWGWCDSFPSASGGPYDDGWFWFRKDGNVNWLSQRDWDFSFRTYGY